ncbi:MAG: hypothetical protein ABSC56_11465 [Solirubrobacteraceae bacterium]|jgi:hypothetical protein
MQSAHPAPPHPSRELRRRLRARARRVRILRRRVGALTVALLLTAWGAVFAIGPMGHASTASATKVALVYTRGHKTGKRSASKKANAVSSSEGTSSSSSAASTVSPVTTSQS